MDRGCKEASLGSAMPVTAVWVHSCYADRYQWHHQGCFGKSVTSVTWWSCISWCRQWLDMVHVRWLLPRQYRHQLVLLALQGGSTPPGGPLPPLKNPSLLKLPPLWGSVVSFQDSTPLGVQPLHGPLGLPSLQARILLDSSPPWHSPGLPPFPAQTLLGPMLPLWTQGRDPCWPCRYSSTLL